MREKYYWLADLGLAETTLSNGEAVALSAAVAAAALLKAVVEALSATAASVASASARYLQLLLEIIH